MKETVYFWPMAGIYIHIPFCKQKCTYCDFHFSTSFSSYRERMLKAIKMEIEERCNFLEKKKVETIYFGGGTPSLLNGSELQGILDTISTHFEVADLAEISLEANPDDCTRENLESWKKVGVNRLSIGVQSFKESDLVWMNRAHNADEAEKCVQLAQSSGFENITVDLMYGLPNLSEEEWKSHILKVIDWGVPHISSYCLTVEERTALEKKVKEGILAIPNDEIQSRQFEILLETLEKNGIQQYEISNFSKPGFESKHNGNYWKGAWYLGVGPSAHSFNGDSRTWNVSNNFKYMQALDGNERSYEIEVLKPEDRFNELLLTGLRTVKGVDRSQLEAIRVLDSSFLLRISDFKSAGWLELLGNQIVLTKEGRLRADYIASELFLVD